MLAQSNSEFMEFLKMIDSELLGAVMIIGTIGIFISFIVVVVSIARTWNSIAMVRMNQNMIRELLAKGYSIDDIERIAHGGQRWGHQFRKMLHSATSRLADIARRHHYENRPVPPMKQST